MKRKIVTAAAAAVVALYASASLAGIDKAKKWVNEEFQPSTLSVADQMKEMQWFIDAAAPFKGM
jgi:glycerol transport system substrate-binding protein